MIVSVTQVPRAKQTIRAGVKQWQSRMEMGKHDLVCHCSSSGIELLFREDTRRSFEETTTAGRQSLHVTKGDGCRLERNAMSKGRKNILFGSSSKNTRAFLIVVMPFFIIYRQQSFVERLHNSESFNLKFLVKTKK